MDLDRLEEALELAAVQGRLAEARTLLLALVDGGGGARPAPKFILQSLRIDGRAGCRYEDVTSELRRFGHESLVAPAIVDRLLGDEVYERNPDMVPPFLLRPLEK
ncbi:MAG: hypothetical protein ACFB9M_20020 [Myxococcota bacterium]